MKYIDSEKLIAKIERQNVDKKVIEPLIRIITSLQQEQPEVDLEKEYKEWWETRVSGNVNIEHTMEWFMHETARHFYELGQQNRLKVSYNSLEELRKEVIKFNQDHFDELHSDMDTIDIVHVVASHFAEWGAIHLNARKEE